MCPLFDREKFDAVLGKKRILVGTEKEENKGKHVYASQRTGEVLLISEYPLSLTFFICLPLFILSSPAHPPSSPIFFSYLPTCLLPLLGEKESV